MQYPAKTRRWLKAFVVFSLIIMFGLPGSTQPPQQISERARAVGIAWLLSNCEVGEGTRLTSQLVLFKVELEPFFLQALQQGPDEKQLSDLQRTSEARYQQRQEVLKSGRFPLKDEDLKAAQSVTREQYMAQEKEDFVLRYKSQAVAGLGIVGGPKARAALVPLSKDDKSPLKTSALEALRTMAGGGKKPGPR
jgi:hypothetical protein